MKALLPSFVLVFQLIIKCLIAKEIRLPTLHLQQRAHLLQSSVSVAPKDEYSERYVTQRIDHFSSANRATFQQRYVVNTKYNTTAGLHFLWVEGVGELYPERITASDYPLITYAKESGATLWALEHRFYGKSRPFNTLSTNTNLVYLRSQQAIEDVADFIRTQNKNLNQTNPKWVVFGASYGGSLVLWFRQKYPGLCIGTVASSPESVSTIDNYQYNSVVEKAYSELNKPCYKNIATSLQTVRQLMDNVKGRKQLSDEIRLEPSFSQLKMTYHDYQLFYNTAVNHLSFPVQVNEIIKGYGVAEVCKIMCDSSLTDVAKIKKVIYLNIDQINYSNVYNNYTGLIEYLKTEDYSDYTAAEERLYYWQTCNEIGFFPTTDFGGTFFSSMLPNNFNLEICADVFGPFFDINYVEKAVEITKMSYGGTNVYYGTSVVITQGTLDPWSGIGYKYITDKADSAYYEIQKGAHCSEVYPATSTDSAGVKLARSLISRRLKAWIKGDGKKRAYRPTGTMDLNVMKGNQSLHQFSQERTDIVNLEGNIEHNSLAMESYFKEFFQKSSSCVGIPFSTSPCVSMVPEAIEQRPAAKIGSIEQDLDHFDSKNSKKWKQSYYYNDTNYKSGGPVFLWLNGEGGNDDYYVQDGMALASWAKSLNGMVVSLGHRFYGDNQPTGNLTRASLKYLRTDQVLADIAVFINSINKVLMSNGKKPKWIAFGCGYAGNLAAWLREKYPSYVSGAVVSSGPLQAEADFYRYLYGVQRTLEQHAPQGCADDVGRLFVQLQNLTTTIEGRKNISKLAKLCDDWSTDYVPRKDIETFMVGIINGLTSAVMSDTSDFRYTKAYCELTTKVLDQMKNMGMGTAQSVDFEHNMKKHPLNLLSNLISEVNPDSATGGTCWDVSYANYVALVNRTETFSYRSASRVLFWQSCTVFGQFLSSNLGYNIFESALPINHLMDFCTDLFGPDYNRSSVEYATLNLNYNYGGNANYTASNVIFVNGDADPWYPLTYLPNPKNTDVVIIRLPGLTHCADIWAETDKSPKSVKDAHVTIKKKISNWVK